MVICHQCPKPALYWIGDEKIPLCLDCYERHQNLLQQQLDQSAALADYATAQMEVMTGLPLGTLGPRLSRPRPVQSQPLTFNNIRINDSNVGVVNTGQAHTIDTVVSYTQQQGDPALSQALKVFTQAVIDNNEIDKKTRDAIIEQLSFLASQIATDKKQPSISQSVLSGLEKTIATISGLLTLWSQLGPLLRASLGL